MLRMWRFGAHRPELSNAFQRTAWRRTRSERRRPPPSQSAWGIRCWWRKRTSSCCCDPARCACWRATACPSGAAGRPWTPGKRVELRLHARQPGLRPHHRPGGAQSGCKMKKRQQKTRDAGSQTGQEIAGNFSTSQFLVLTTDRRHRRRYQKAVERRRQQRVKRSGDATGRPWIPGGDWRGSPKSQ